MAEYGNMPFGLNQVKIKSRATVPVLVTLEAAQTMNFVPRMLTGELKGNDKLVALASMVEALEWSLTEGSIPLAALAIMTGWTATESGSTPNRTNTLTARSETEMPYFTIYGKALGQAGDDTHVKIFKAKITGNIEGAFEYGVFKITSMSGIAVEDTTDGLFDIVQNETAAALPTS